MVAGVYNIIVEQGGTYGETVTISQSGTPLNLTGYTAELKVGIDESTKGDILDLTSSSGLTMGGALGTIAILITAAVTKTLPPNTYIYDLVIINGTTRTYILEGSFTVVARKSK